MRFYSNSSYQNISIILLSSEIVARFFVVANIAARYITDLLFSSHCISSHYRYLVLLELEERRGGKMETLNYAPLAVKCICACNPTFCFVDFKDN